MNNKGPFTANFSMLYAKYIRIKYWYATRLTFFYQHCTAESYQGHNMIPRLYTATPTLICPPFYLSIFIAVGLSSNSFCTVGFWYTSMVWFCDCPSKDWFYLSCFPCLSLPLCGCPAKLPFLEAVSFLLFLEKSNTKII